MRSGHQLVIFVGVVIVFLAIGVYVTFFAPCSALGWVATKDLPARCLKGYMR